MDSTNHIAAVPIVDQAPVAPEIAPAVTTPVVEKEVTTAPLSLFERDNGVPYAATQFGFNKADFDALQTADIQSLIPKIELVGNWITQKIQTEEYPDSTASFDSILANIKEQLGIRDDEPLTRQLEKVYLYLNEGRSSAQEFFVPRSSKADEIDMLRHQRTSQFREKQPAVFRRIDSMFSKFFHK